MKINSTESYDFFLARTYRARIQLIFTNTRGFQYSPYINLFVSPYRVPNMTLGTKYKYTNEYKNGISNVPKHGNKYDLIHFVTAIEICNDLTSYIINSMMTTFDVIMKFNA